MFSMWPLAAPAGPAKNEREERYLRSLGGLQCEKEAAAAAADDDDDDEFGAAKTMKGS